MDIDKLHKFFLKSTGVSTDTRTLRPGDIYFALSGENFNGNKFAAEALESGAIYSVINEKHYEIKDKTILVDDVLKALQGLSSYHRNYLDLPIIALTGSNGKTTTKELFNAVLSQKYRTIATQGNLNNHIGVPLTLLRMNKNTELGIIEMGANHLKEIEQLCQIAQPNFGYITNFGKAHLEGFGSVEGVLKGKSELYKHLRTKKGMAFVNADDPKQMKQSEGMDTFTFGKTKDCDLMILDATAQPFVEIKLESSTINSQLIGSYNTANITAALAVGQYFKVPQSEIKKAVANYIPTNNRSQLVKQGSATIIMDAYNANPTSMEAALTHFGQLPAEHKMLFLGDMFELGGSALEEHERIAALALSLNAEAIFLMGKNFEKVNVKKDNVFNFENTESLEHNFPEKAKELLKKDVHILIKGSRGMAMERLLPMLKEYIQ